MRRLSRRRVLYLVFAALLVLIARRALPTSKMWGPLGRQRGTGYLVRSETFPKYNIPSRYSHQVENVPAPRRADTETTDRKDKPVAVVGSSADLVAKTDSLLAQWVSKEQEASISKDSSISDREHTTERGNTIDGKPSVSHIVSPTGSGTIGDVQAT